MIMSHSTGGASHSPEERLLQEESPGPAPVDGGTVYVRTGF